MSQNSFDNNYSLSEENNVPLYYQLMTLLKVQIGTGLLKPGDSIPSESQLCTQYKVSRSTVRQALNQLVEENLIIRRRGKGSFVASQKLQRNLNHLYSFTEDMLVAGLKPRSKVIACSIINAPGEIMDALDLPRDRNKVFKLIRLRIANDEPLLLETTYIPYYLCSGIEDEDFTSASLYNILRTRYNLSLYKAVETYDCIKLDKDAAAFLKCKVSSCAFNIHRTAYLDTGAPFEFTSSVARSDKCAFKVELYADKNKVNFSRHIHL